MVTGTISVSSFNVLSPYVRTKQPSIGWFCCLLHSNPTNRVFFQQLSPPYIRRICISWFDFIHQYRLFFIDFHQVSSFPSFLAASGTWEYLHLYQNRPCLFCWIIQPEIFISTMQFFNKVSQSRTNDPDRGGGGDDSGQESNLSPCCAGPRCLHD